MRRLVAESGGDEAFDFPDGGDVASGSGAGAVEGRGGAGEVELATERPVLMKAVEEAGVENVACAGGVDGGDAVGGGVVELGSIPCENAVFAEGGCGEFCPVAALHLAEGGFEVGLGHQAAGEVAADDEVVDVDEEIFDAGIKFVEVGDDGNVGGLGPLRGDRGGGGVVAVDVEEAGVDDPIAVKVVGMEDEAVVAMAEDSSLAIAVNQDDGLGASGVGDGDEPGLNAGEGEGFTMEFGGVVIAELANVAGDHAPALAGDHGGCDLAAGEDGLVVIFDLGAALGIVGQRDEGVGGIQAYADQVDGSVGRVLHDSTIDGYCDHEL